MELKKAERKRLFDDYLDATEKYEILRKIKQQTKPTSPEYIDPMYGYACNNIEFYKFQAEEAQTKLFLFEKKQKTY